MKALLSWTLTVFAALSGVSPAQSIAKNNSSSSTAKERLVGAWRLVSMEEPDADGKLHRITNRQGMLLYTRDGHMSVQLMFPKPESTLTNDYVLNGYEASFGSYDVNEAAQTVTHHVQGSNTRGLVGRDLLRAFRFAEGRLIIRSARPDERWSVTWEHY
jgi:hypothetical protein